MKNYNYTIGRTKNEKTRIYDRIYLIVLFIYIGTIYTQGLLSFSISLQRVSLYAFYILSFGSLLFYKRKLPIYYITWYGLFLLFTLFSFFYAPSEYHFFWGFKKILNIFIFGLSLLIFFQMQNSMPKLMNIYIVIATLTGVFIILTYEPQHAWSRLGFDFGQNPNQIGLMYLLPLVFSIRKAYIDEMRLVNIMLSGLFFYIILLTGSKKALLGGVIFVVIYLLLQPSIKNKIKNILLTIIILAIILTLLKNVSFFYNIIGYRMEDFFELIVFPSIKSTSSTNLIRHQLIKQGLDIFADNPILGVGMNNFAYFSGVYTHNNYIEILVNLGVIGFITYYSIHLITGYKLFILSRKNMSEEIAYYIAIFVTLLFYDIGMVSYDSINIVVLLLILLNGVNSKYSVSFTRQKNDIEHYIINSIQ